MSKNINMCDYLEFCLMGYDNRYKPLIELLWKNSNSLSFVKKEETKKFPLFVFEIDKIFLWYKDEMVSTNPFVFSSPEEAILIIQNYFFTGENAFVLNNLPSFIHKEFVKSKLNKSLEDDDIESFKYWRSFLENI